MQSGRGPGSRSKMPPHPHPPTPPQQPGCNCTPATRRKQDSNVSDQSHMAVIKYTNTFKIKQHGKWCLPVSRLASLQFLLGNQRERLPLPAEPAGSSRTSQLPWPRPAWYPAAEGHGHLSLGDEGAAAKTERPPQAELPPPQAHLPCFEPGGL